MVVTLKGWSSHSKTLQFECVAEKDFDNTAQKLIMIVVTKMEKLRKTRKENLLQNQKEKITKSVVGTFTLAQEEDLGSKVF